MEKGKTKLTSENEYQMIFKISILRDAFHCVFFISYGLFFLELRRTSALNGNIFQIGNTVEFLFSFFLFDFLLAIINCIVPISIRYTIQHNILAHEFNHLSIWLARRIYSSKEQC